MGADSQIILLYEAISVPDADALFLVLEYLPGGTLMEVHVGGDTSAARPPFPREQAREYFRQLCLGLEYLHHNEVVHRDVSSFPPPHKLQSIGKLFLVGINTWRAGNMDMGQYGSTRPDVPCRSNLIMSFCRPIGRRSNYVISECQRCLSVRMIG